MEKETLIRCEKISKDFGITKALKEVDFEVKRGMICGLIGENGSGKSTLSSIISGIYSPSGGTMTYKGNAWKPRDVMESQENGICIIVQEAGTIPRLTVAENIFLGQEKRFLKGFLIDYKKMYEEAGHLLSEMGIHSIKPQMPIASLNLQERKLVEIAKAYNYDPEILIVDETTNALSHKERQLLFDLIHKMAQENKAVIIISHDIEEVMEHCSSISILKDGEMVSTVKSQDVTARKIKEMMVGRDVEEGFYRSDMDGYSDEVVLKADNITTLREIMNLSLELHKGEILGIGGLSDCGMHTLGKALYGEEQVLSGSVTAGSSKAVIKDAEPLSSIYSKEHCNAVLEIWIPGDTGGTALAEVLFGDYNPAGRLPMTAARTEGQIPIYAAHKRGSGYSRTLGMTLCKYVEGDKQPLYYLGEGKSYTTFAYSDLEVQPSVKPDGKVTVSLKVKNTGDMDGDEVVQIYVSDQTACMIRPVKELAGFARVFLKKGEEKTVVFRMKASQFAFLDQKMNWIVEAGKMTVMAGGSSEDLPLCGEFMIEDTAVIEGSSRGLFAEVVNE